MSISSSHKCGLE